MHLASTIVSTIDAWAWTRSGTFSRRRCVTWYLETTCRFSIVLFPFTNCVRILLQGNVGLYVVMIGRKYYYTTYEVSVQVFNDVCQEPACEGPKSDPVTIYSAEDMPQVAPTQVR